MKELRLPIQGYARVQFLQFKDIAQTLSLFTNYLHKIIQLHVISAQIMGNVLLSLAMIIAQIMV